MLRKIFIGFISWRVLLFLVPLATDRLLEFRKGFNYVSGDVWANFDGIYYLYIAKAGYTVDNAGFFPLYPFLIKIFSIGESSIQFHVGTILSSIFLLLGIIMFHKLVRVDFSSKVAFLAIFFILIFPTSFFFATIYSESLFLFLLVSSFYFARKRNWFLASLFAGLLTATRIVGIAIIPALIYEFIKSEKSMVQKKALYLLLSPLGLISYVYFNFKEWGSPFVFSIAQGNLQNGRSTDEIVLLPQTIYRYFNILISVSPSVFEWWVALLEISAFIFAVVMLCIAWKKKIRSSYVLFSAIALLIPASTGTLTGMPRYVLVAFPIFIAFALLKGKWLKIVYSVVGVILLTLLFTLFSKGYYIS